MPGPHGSRVPPEIVGLCRRRFYLLLFKTLRFKVKGLGFGARGLGFKAQFKDLTRILGLGVGSGLKRLGV